MGGVKSTLVVDRVEGPMTVPLITQFVPTRADYDPV
jgi:hypothetical protein